jgi:hypothetical protein
MGLDPTGTTAGAKRFSADVLKFVICGKSQQNLTIVDVPGKFSDSDSVVHLLTHS